MNWEIWFPLKQNENQQKQIDINPELAYVVLWLSSKILSLT